MFVIFGATGRVGGAAAAELRRRGFEVRAVTRDIVRGHRLKEAGCEVVAADLYDEESIRRAMSGAEGVLILCPLRALAEDVMADAERVLEAVGGAIDAAKPPAVVAISDYGAEHPSGTGITTIFNRLETRWRRTASPITFVRSAEHMQNWSRYAPLARNRGVLPSMHHPMAKLFPTVSAHDVGLEAADLLAAPAGRVGEPRIVHVEGPRRYSVVDVAEAFSALVSRPVTAEELPRARWERTLTSAGLGESYARLVVELGDAHNAGRIDCEEGAGEVRRGRTTLSEALAAALVR